MKNAIKILILASSLFFIYNCTTRSKVHTVVEEMPSYPGGEGEMYRFIHENLKYPVMSQEFAMQGRTTLRFIVSKTGKIKNIEKVKDIDNPLADSLIKIIKMMPDWKPGKQNGKAVDVYYTLPIMIHPRK